MLRPSGGKIDTFISPSHCLICVLWDFLHVFRNYAFSWLSNCEFYILLLKSSFDCIYLSIILYLFVHTWTSMWMSVWLGLRIMHMWSSGDNFQKQFYLPTMWDPGAEPRVLKCQVWQSASSFCTHPLTPTKYIPCIAQKNFALTQS